MDFFNILLDVLASYQFVRLVDGIDFFHDQVQLHRHLIQIPIIGWSWTSSGVGFWPHQIISISNKPLLLARIAVSIGSSMTYSPEAYCGVK